MTDTTQKDYLSLPMVEFLSDLGSGSPTPGGGSAASCTGAIGVNLGHMVATFALRRAQKQGTETEPIVHAMARLDRGARLLSGLIAEDIAAYDLWRRASKLDSKDPTAAQQKQLSLTAALAIPSQILATCAACLRDMAALAPLSSKYLWTDLAGAAHMTLAAAEAAAWTVYANLSSPELAAAEQTRIRDEVKHLQNEANRACREVTDYVRAKVLGGQ
jgi:formiminotetrahydrofolate cyclodeaminase